MFVFKSVTLIFFFFFLSDAMKLTQIFHLHQCFGNTTAINKILASKEKKNPTKQKKKKEKEKKMVVDRLGESWSNTVWNMPALASLFA